MEIRENIAKFASSMRAFVARNWKLFLSSALISGILFSLIFGLSFRRERAMREVEWNDKVVVRPYTPDRVRGLMQSVIRDWQTQVGRRERGESADPSGPSFIPQYMWRGSYCAAAAIQTVNGLLGRSHLRLSSAWMLETFNSGLVERVFDRSQDFEVREDRIEELIDSPIHLSRHLRLVGEPSHQTNATIYIIGYRYKDTRADPLILQDRARWGEDRVGINSHLMVLLGHEGDGWWVLHFFHDPKHPDDSPFRVENVGDDQVTARFDIVYIWEVRGIPDMPAEGVPVHFVSSTRPYRELRPWLGRFAFAGESVSSFMDTALIGFVGDADQYPHVERYRNPVIPSSSPVSPFARADAGVRDASVTDASASSDAGSEVRLRPTVVRPSPALLRRLRRHQRHPSRRRHHHHHR